MAAGQADGLERQNRLLAAALSNMPHGLAMFDGAQRLILCNPIYARMYKLPEHLAREGTHRRDIIRHCIDAGWGPVDLDQYTAIAREANRLRQPALGRVRLTDGRVVKISYSPIENHSYVSTHEDVTEKTRITDELSRAKDTLEARVRERTALVWRQAETLERLLAQERQINDNQLQFVAMASHEFRTPLTIIDGAAQRLLRQRGRDDPEYVAEKAQQIRGSVARLIDLIESILENGRRDAGPRTPIYDSIDLAELLRLCCERQAGIQRTHRFHLDLSGLTTLIHGDQSGLERVFTNLLSNAVKYSRGAPDIRVCAAIEEDIVTISVEDDGIGIDSEDLPRMFGRYFRARTATGIPGTGIGLHLVRQIVEMHQGVIDVSSTPGRGSRFTVRLPVSRPETTAGCPRPATSSTPRAA